MKTWQYVKKGQMPKPRTTVIAAVRSKETTWAGGEYFKDEIIEAFYDDTDKRWWTHEDEGYTTVKVSGEVYAWHELEEPPEYI